MRFYRIIDMFIDQAGSHASSSIWGTTFDDDPGGLALRHDRPGLLSAANSGPDTNSGHFSIVVAPAPHLDGGYTIFGEVTAGWDVVSHPSDYCERFSASWALVHFHADASRRPRAMQMMAVNRLDKHDKGRTAKVIRAGCLSNCDPRPDVGPKCKTRSKTTAQVQGKNLLKCLD